MKRIEYDKGAYMRALQRGESEESARATAGWKETEEFHLMQNFMGRYKSWRYKTKQNKLEKIWEKQLERDNHKKNSKK